MANWRSQVLEGSSSSDCICLCCKFKKWCQWCLEVSTSSFWQTLLGVTALLLLIQGRWDAWEVRLTETHCDMSEPTENVPPVHYLWLSWIYIISSFLKVICFGLCRAGQHIKGMLSSGNKTLRFMVTEVLNITHKLQGEYFKWAMAQRTVGAPSLHILIATACLIKYR